MISEAKRKPYICGSCSLVAQLVKNLPAMPETQVRSLGQEDPLEKGMITHSSILAWRIPRTKDPGRPQSMGSQSDTTEQLTLANYTIKLIVCVFTL